MAEAETSSAKIAYVLESTPGTNPGTGAKFLRITSDSMKQSQSRVTSEEVTGNRLPRESIRTGTSADGGVEFEFSVNNFDDLIVGLMMNSLPAVPTLLTGSMAVDGTLGKFTSGSGTPGFLSIVKGQWFRSSGFSTAANNGIFQAASAGTLTEVVVGTGAGLVTEASAAARNVAPSQMIRPGSTLKTFSLERQWTDVAVYEQFNGMAIESLSIKMAVDQKITGSVTFMGLSAAAAATSNGMGSIASAGTESIAAAVDALRGVRESSMVADTTYKTTELGFQFSNKTRFKKDAASVAAFGIGLGVLECNIDWKIFLTNKNLIDKFRNNTTTALSFRIEGPASTDPDYVFTFAKVRITDQDDGIGGNSEDGFLNMKLQAETSSDGFAVQIDKVPA